MNDYQYQVGGSLKITAPSYVSRQADTEIYDALIKGEFCYVLNCRQMGKSSLRVRIKHRLQQEGFSCASIDITNIGSETITSDQWYKGVASELWRGFNLLKTIHLKTWWNEQEGLSSLQRLSRFIEDVVLAKIEKEKIFIFVDEIDSVLGLNFKIDDFFALIRFCYNQRAENHEYNRLTFALFGVATPSDLIQDRNRTPFNIGKAIELYGFQLDEALPLTKGLEGKISNPKAVLREILTWTGGQPFLTQKLCRLVLQNWESGQWESGEVDNLSCVIKPESSSSGSSPKSIQQIVREAKILKIVKDEIIKNWESRDEPEHLKTIRDRLLMEQKRAGRLLGLYQQILQNGEIAADDSVEQIDLLLSGLVVKREGKLQIYNRIYQAVFNDTWVEKELSKRRPYSEKLRGWAVSNYRDESRLLRGKALQDAQNWAMGKSLSDADYQFLAASQELEKQEVKSALATAKEANQILEAAQEKAQKTIKRGLVVLASISLVVGVLLGASYFLAMEATKEKQKAIINAIESQVISSEALFSGDRKFDALLESLRAGNKLEATKAADANRGLKIKLETALQQAIFWAVERNRLQGNEDSVITASFSPDGNFIATGDRAGTVKIWRRDGKLLETIAAHTDAVWSVAWSADGETIATASENTSVKLWKPDGTLLETLRGHEAWVVSVIFSPDNTIITTSWDGTVKIWNPNGDNIKTLASHNAGVFDISFSPDGETFATASRDGTVKLWSQDGENIKTMLAHDDWVFSVSFSPDGETIATGSRNGMVKLWNRNGEMLAILPGHDAPVFGVSFSPDGKTLASASWDTTVKLWSLDFSRMRGKSDKKIDGEELQTLPGHNDSVWSLDFSPDGKTLATTSEDGTVKLWSLRGDRAKAFMAHESAIRGVSFSPDGETIATGGMDMTVKLWNKNGELRRTLPRQNTAIRDVSFSPDGKAIATATWGQAVKLWNPDGEEIHALLGHEGAVWSVSFSPDSELLASASEDKMVKIWRVADGGEVGTLRGHEAAVFSVSFSPDGETVATGSEDKAVKLWNVSGEELKTLGIHEDWVVGVSFLPGDAIASASRDGVVKIWNSDGEEIKSFGNQGDSIWSASFSPDGKMVALASRDGTVKLWNIEKEKLKIIRGHRGAVRSVRFSADSKSLISADAVGVAIVWNLDVDWDLEGLLVRGCDWVRDYLRHNPMVSKSDRVLCDF